MPKRVLAFAALLFACAVSAVSVSGQASRPATSTAGMPPIIDRELIFGDPEIAGSQISPDGQFLSFLRPYKGTRNIWVKRASEPFENAKAITAETKRPISQYFWSRDGKFILYAMDSGGDENFNVYAVNPADAPAAGSDVPAARNLTDAKGVQTHIYAVPKADPELIYIGINDRDKAWHDLYKVKISTGEKTLIRKNTERLTGWEFDLTGKARLATRAAENGDTEVLRLDDNGFTKIYTCNVFETCGPVRFHKDGKRVYFITNKGADLVRLTLFDVGTSQEQLVELDPLNRVDLVNALFSDKSEDLIATVYIDEKVRINWKDKAYEADHKLLESKLPGKEIGYQSSTKDERLQIVVARADVDPGAVYIFDRQTKTLTPQYVVRSALPRASLSPMTGIRYKSSDGLEIPAYLTLPKGLEPKNLPLIVVPHGGPWARDVWGYNPWAQFFANRGYAVLQPNFRGSTGYGKKYLDAGNKQWGDKMQDDITWGVKHLVAQGTADAKRVGIFGGSYGGYATLAGVTFTPDVYSAAVAFVGPSNLITLLNSIPPYWEAGRKLFTERMGDPSTPEGKAQLERQSPLNSAAKIRTPLMVIQGQNDPRVKKAESEQIVVALRDRGFAVEYLMANDEGHGFARPVNNMAAFAAMEKFLAKHLQGRFQEGMSTEVAARLKEITIDPKTVEKPKAATLGSGTPKPVRDLEPGKSSYTLRMEMGQQKMDLAATSEIKEQNGAWLVTETMKTPMGEATDQGIVEKGSLVLRKRTLKQGPMTLEYESKDGKVTGTLTMGGAPKPIAADVGGELFADGPGALDAIARLPLAEGFSTAFRNFDPQTQQVKTVEIKVAGSEQVTVPAGTFDAFKIEVADGPKTATQWVAKDTRQVVKVVAHLPNGATTTMELQK